MKNANTWEGGHFGPLDDKQGIKAVVGHDRREGLCCKGTKCLSLRRVFTRIQKYDSEPAKTTTGVIVLAPA